MTDSKLTEFLQSPHKDYLHRGQHFVKVFSVADLQTPVKLPLPEGQPPEGQPPEDQPPSQSLTAVITEIWKAIQSRSAGSEEIRFIFTGNVNDVSLMEGQRWFQEFIRLPNKIAKHVCNTKLRIFLHLTDLFLSVYSTEGADSTKCNFEQTILLHPDLSEADLQFRLVWYNHLYSSKGDGAWSAYKIFYVVALGTENSPISSSPGGMIENRFITEDRIKEARFHLTVLRRVLKEIHFSENDVNRIIDTVVGLVELSQYRASGDGKKLEFHGLHHLKRAAENLLVKESQLKAFIVNEYVWQDNKRRLKTPDMVNSELDAFIGAVYDVLVQSVWSRYNRSLNNEIHTDAMVSLKFIYSPSLPQFSKERVHTFGDYFQYHFSTSFEAVASTILHEQMNTFINSTPWKDVRNKNSECRSLPRQSVVIFDSVCRKIEEYKNSRNKSEYVQKLERSNFKEIKFLKINHQIFLDIYIPEVVSFIRFSWHSFIEGSETFCSKQMKAFLKLSGNSLLNSFAFRETPGRIWTVDEFSSVWSSKDLFDRNVFFIHSLMEDVHQASSNYSLKSQIGSGNLHCLDNDDLVLEVIPLDEFVRSYGVAFLNWNARSRSVLEAAQHGICRLDLERAWCCPHYIHLSGDHISVLRTIVESYNENVTKIQRYAKVILAKIKLKQLKLLSDQYKEEYLEALTGSQNFFKQFTDESSRIFTIDRESRDLKVLSAVLPDQNTVEAFKTFEKTNTKWLYVTISSGLTVLHREIFSRYQACVFQSSEQRRHPNNSMDVSQYVPAAVRGQISNVFILKIQGQLDGDVVIDVKAATPLYAWNVRTEENRWKRKHLPLSRGSLLSGNRYRIFSNDYFMNKLAYNTLNKIPYESFHELVHDCTTAIIIQKNLQNENCLAVSPLWMSITNCLPLINLESTSTFNQVETRRKTIDKMECSRYVDYLHIRPRDDWILENVATELQFLSTEDDAERVTSDHMDIGRNGILRTSTRILEPRNYRTRKFISNS